MSPAAPTEGRSPPPDCVEVLVVDDNATNVFILTAMLRSLGVSTLRAADGVEAVQIATERLPAVILMDVQMPHMDGITATRRIRDSVSDRRAAIVAVTAYPEVRDLPAFKTAEFDDFLMKPVELSALRRAMEKWLHNGGANGQAPATRT